MRGEFRARKAKRAGAGAEEMIAQIDDLEARLAALAMTPAQVLTDEERASDWLAKKAFKRVWLDGPYAKTHAMLNPPRRVLEQRALRGHWPRFPIDPSGYEPVFARFTRDTLCNHGSDTTYLARTIEFEVESARRRLRCPARVLALHRCALTLILEAMNHLDDSGADMARAYSEIERRYLELLETECTDAVLRDLLELFVWEDFGLSEAIEPFLRTLREDRADVAARELARITTELRAHELDDQLARARRARAAVLASRPAFDGRLDEA